jgi:putative phage-type endonuclease
MQNEYKTMESIKLDMKKWNQEEKEEKMEKCTQPYEEEPITEKKVIHNLTFILDKDLPKCSIRKQEYFEKQVEHLMKLPQPVQRSEEWYLFRNDLVTASNWGSILAMNPYQKMEQVLLEKCGDVSNFKGNSNMEWGQKYEPVACMIYEGRNQNKVIEFGCIRHPYIDYLGASPDGITRDGIMLEIKCPPKREITGIIPPYYWCQVQGQLEVCDLERCDFLECCIKEYENKSDYLQDHYEGDFSRNSYGHEKGVILELFRSKDKSFYYVYSPLCIDEMGIQQWKEEIIESENKKHDVKLSFTYYWYLEKVSCIPIYRNQEWFQSALPQLKSFWDNVLKYRKLGLNVLKSDLKRSKEEIKEKKQNEKNGKSTAKKQKKDSKETKKTIDLEDTTSILPYCINHSQEHMEEMDENEEDMHHSNNTNLFLYE